MKIFDIAKSLFKIASAAVVVTSAGCAGSSNDVVVNQNPSELLPQSSTDQVAGQTNASLPATATQYTAEQGSTVKVGQITWFENYDEALLVAKEQNKPLWLHFGENPG